MQPQSHTLMMLLALLAVASTLTAGQEQHSKYRSFNGSGNNLAHPDWGAAGTPFIRIQVPAGYSDASSQLTGSNRPGARAISLALMATNYPDKLRYTEQLTSDMLTYMGQSFTHDLERIVGGDASDAAPIPIPRGDPFFDPQGLGNLTIPFTRSDYNKSDTSAYRAPINAVSTFVDGSIVYGSSQAVSDALRTRSGGKLAVLADPELGAMLPTVQSIDLPPGFMANAAMRVPGLTLRAAGDVRGNVNAPILAFQTVWLREHNRLATELAAAHPDWDDETLFQEARKWNIAYMQRVCFYEYMPALGIRLPPYGGYNASVNPSIDVFFSTVAYRYGHSEVTDVVLRIDDEGNEVPAGHLLLHTTYFNPNVSLLAGVDPVLRGLSIRVQGYVEPRFSQAIQNYLFGLPGVNGSDIFAINIQRARDHGVPDYNTCRKALGLPPVASFTNFTDDPSIVAALTELYGTPDNCDPYVCGIAEKKLPGNHFGPLFNASLTDQYIRLRDGDWYYFENKANGAFTDAEVATIRATNFRTIIQRNTGIKVLPENIWNVDAEQPWPNAACAAVNSSSGMPEGPNQMVTLSGGRYTLGWKFVSGAGGAEAAEITVSARGNGWVGFGIAATANSAMMDADIVMARVLPDGSTRVDDMWSSGFTAPQTDASLGCTSQVEAVSSSQSAGVTTVTFRRPLAASDRCDRSLSKDGTNFLIFAFNPDSDDITRYHSSNRGVAIINLASGPGGSVLVDDGGKGSRDYHILRTHGILMIIAFCILMPLAALSNRIKNTHMVAVRPSLVPAFFYLHIMLNVSAVALAAAGFALNFVRLKDLKYDQVPYSHGKLGVAIMALLFVQALYPWFRPAPSPLTWIRRAWELLHTTLGRAIIVLGLVNVAIGILIATSVFQGNMLTYSCLAAVPIGVIVVASSIIDRTSAQSARLAADAAPQGKVGPDGDQITPPHKLESIATP